MPRYKEIQEQTRNEIIDLQKRYKVILNALGLQQIIARDVIHTLRKQGLVMILPRSLNSSFIFILQNTSE